MSSIERHLISTVLHSGDISGLADEGVTPAVFLDTSHRDAFQMIVEHHAEYGAVPSIEAFKADYPTYRITDPPDPLLYYVNEIRIDYQRFLIETGISAIIERYDSGDLDGTKTELARVLRDVYAESGKSRVTDLTQTSEQRLERYEAYRKRDGSLRGISSGFASIDHYTEGFQPQQLITFVGPPAAGKSTLMILADLAAHKAAYRPMFIGFEMSNTEQEERHDAIRAGISHSKLRKGELNAEEMMALKRMMARTEHMPPMIFSEDASASMTVGGVEDQVERYKPDIVFIDGCYLMDDEQGERKGSPQALTNITRTLKQQARRRNIPYVISTQILEWKMDRKKGVTSNSIGYSSSFLQDSDEIIAVEKTDDGQINKLKSIKSRNSQGAEVFVMWDWSTGRFEELQEREVREDDNPASF